MLPISDDNSSRKTFPIITYALIALNLLIFFLELTGGDAFILFMVIHPWKVLIKSSRGIYYHIFRNVHACRVDPPAR